VKNIDRQNSRTVRAPFAAEFFSVNVLDEEKKF
jgi:hypothetical protein